MASVSRQSTVKSLSPKIVKKIEQEIINEAKSEEQFLKAAADDLHHTEKDEQKANKATAKAERLLEKAEKKEQRALKSLYRAENAHNVALSNVTQAQNGYEMSAKQHAKTRESLEKKTVKINEAMKVNDEHTKSRNARLAALRGPSGKDEAGRVIPDPSATTA